MKNRQNAEWLLKRASHYREAGGIELAKACASAAQAEATLALAEQYRIANLIALGAYHLGNDLPPFRNLVMEPCNEIDVEPTEDIREALGIPAARRPPRSDRDRAWDGGLDGGRLG